MSEAPMGPNEWEDVRKHHDLFVAEMTREMQLHGEAVTPARADIPFADEHAANTPAYEVFGRRVLS